MKECVGRSRDPHNLTVRQRRSHKLTSFVSDDRQIPTPASVSAEERSLPVHSKTAPMHQMGLPQQQQQCAVATVQPVSTRTLHIFWHWPALQRERTCSSGQCCLHQGNKVRGSADLFLMRDNQAQSMEDQSQVSPFSAGADLIGWNKEKGAASAATVTHHRCHSAADQSSWRELQRLHLDLHCRSE